MNTTRTAEGGSYRRKQVIFSPQQESPSFRQLLIARSMVNLPGAPDIMGAAGSGRPGQGVQVSSVDADGRPGRKVFEPDHPDADVEGFVEYPDIDPVTEMADMLSPTRA